MTYGEALCLDVRDADPYPRVLLTSLPCAVRMGFESWRLPLAEAVSAHFHNL